MQILYHKNICFGLRNNLYRQ